jgi:hypothetical protein
MKARLGIAPIAWSNDDLPELGGETTLETCLRESFPRPQPSSLQSSRRTI